MMNKNINNKNVYMVEDEDCAEMPYFLENKDWYYHDGIIYQLTDKAPQKAVDSYNKWYSGELDGDGVWL